MKQSSENLLESKNTIDRNNETSKELIKNLSGKKMYNYYSIVEE
jgi:hypothetical protein